MMVAMLLYGAQYPTYLPTAPSLLDVLVKLFVRTVRNGLRCTKLCACDGLCVDEKVDNCNSNQQAEDDESVSCDEGWQEVEEDTEADNVLDIVFDEDEF